MRRRRFLQLTVSAAAAAVVQHSSALSFSAGQITPPAAADVLSLSVGEPALGAFSASLSGRRAVAEPDQMIVLLLEKTGAGTYQWTIDGQSHPTEPLFLQQDRRYRMRMMNATAGVHTVSLRHHSFALTRIHQAPVSGIFTDTLRLERYNVVEADVLMSRSGPLLLRYPSS